VNWTSAKWRVGPIFFKEISFFDFLEESTQPALDQTVAFWEGKIEERDFSFPK
jgi:hypothetical protein